MKTEEIEFLILLKERIDRLAKRSDVDQGKVANILERFVKLSNAQMQQPATIVEHSSEELKSIKSDTHHIRLAVNILGDCTIDYSWIANTRVQKQLIQDNMRMESSILSQEVNESQRFYSFCAFAFYQIEELINFYYFSKYTLDDFKTYLISNNSTLTEYQKKTITDAETLSKIESQKKLYAFENQFFYGQKKTDGSPKYYESVIDKIRKIRNEDVHRCSVIEHDSDGILDKNNSVKMKSYQELTEEDKEVKKKAKLILFLRERNFNLVRDTIKSIKEIVVHDLLRNK
jgi:hypothetical protein